jgi:NitT/TauT family transport system substrate-binding protein
VISVKRSTAIGTLASALGATTIARAQGLTSLKVAGVSEESVLPVLWGQKSGMFRAAGLDVDLTPSSSGSAITAGVVGGSYQVGKSSIIPLVTAYAKNIPIRLVAPGGIYRGAKPHIAMIVRADSPLRTAAQMNGKTIGVPSIDDLYTLSMKAWMDKNGGDSSTLRFVELPLPAIEAALLSRRIDAGGSGTPELQAALDSHNFRIFAHSYDAIAPVFMYSAWFAANDYIENNRSTLATFSRTERQAAAYVNSHPAETVEALAAFTNTPAAEIAKMTRAMMATMLDPKLIQPVIDVCVRYKTIPSTFDGTAMMATAL